ncbi:GGDEF domain-containing protein [Gilvimarinus chinensis]|uniref:GGDEF domain-containing protein n=1 Tax=Gilvimarinus chinensis TaxID=396005 RepID=UPI00037CE7C0|nr:GGDEF domain-containing protein [Gilvimarinus chinensis]
MRKLDLLAFPDRVTYLYYDQVEGGGTSGAWLDDTGLAFRCYREDPAKPSIYCGLSIELLTSTDDLSQGIDLSGFDSLLLDIDVKSTQPRLAIILRNFYPNYSQPDDINTVQHQVLTLRRGDLAEPLKIRFSEFNVSEWWLVNRDVPRELTLPSFSNVIVLGVDLRDNLGPGNHEVRVNQVTAIGELVSAERWYLALLIIWGVGLTVYAIYRSVHWRHKAHGKQKALNSLVNKHRELRHEARELKYLSERDRLTGLQNRMGLELAYERLDKESSAPTAVMLLDIDHFKLINDRYGHAEGDRVIFELAQLLKSSVRSSDIVSRWGGEEFLLILPNTELPQAYQLSEKIRRRVHDACWFDNNKSNVTISIGVVGLRCDESLSQAFSRADTCLYRAKYSGRNQTVTEETI